MAGAFFYCNLDVLTFGTFAETLTRFLMLNCNLDQERFRLLSRIRETGYDRNGDWNFVFREKGAFMAARPADVVSFPSDPEEAETVITQLVLDPETFRESRIALPEKRRMLLISPYRFETDSAAEAGHVYGITLYPDHGRKVPFLSRRKPETQN